MAQSQANRSLHKLGTLSSWISRTDLRGKRIRLFDLRDEVVGRAASAISLILQGKDKPTFEPTADDGDIVVCINADHAVLTGKKFEEKIYYRHSGKPGCLRTSTPALEHAKYDGSAEILWKAVNGMLPKNKLRKKRLGKLVIYNDGNHDFNEEFMFRMDLPARSVRPNKQRWVLPEGFSPMNPAAYWRTWKGADPEWEAKMAEAISKNASDLEGAPPVEPAQSNVDRQGIRLQ